MPAMPAMGQAPAETGSPMSYAGGITPGEVTATPDMWFYQQQMNRRDDPKEAVRRKAEFRTAQREARLAARRWYGMSNSRPLAGTDPVNGDYSARWTSGNQFYPFRWSAANPIIVVNQFPRAHSSY